MHATCLVHFLTLVSTWGKMKTDGNLTLEAVLEQPVKNISYFWGVCSEILAMPKRAR